MEGKGRGAHTHTHTPLLTVLMEAGLRLVWGSPRVASLAFVGAGGVPSSEEYGLDLLVVALLSF